MIYIYNNKLHKPMHRIKKSKTIVKKPKPHAIKESEFDEQAPRYDRPNPNLGGYYVDELWHQDDGIEGWDPIFRARLDRNGPTYFID